MASASLMREVGHSKLVLSNNPEEWGGEGDGSEVHDGDTCAPVADSCQCMTKTPQYCKVISLQLKQIN